VSDAGAQGQSEAGAEVGFDALLERLRSVVERLEGGKLTLEESLAAYEEGVTLARRGHALLDQAEKRVELLVRAGSAGVEVAPFEPDGDAEGGRRDNGRAGADGEDGGGAGGDPGDRDRRR
jgi:exodeoxyribonuclease VII small subunit